MPDRELQPYEAAEAVAQDVGLRRQRKLVEQAGNRVGVIADPRPRRWRTPKARQVHEEQATLALEPCSERLERGPIGQQRVQQHKIAALSDDLDIQP
jgi:hypothetical protein